MATSIRKLYQDTDASYGMKLEAGESGLDRLVEWTHVIEAPEAIKLLHGRELVFTIGILCNRAGWLLDFVKEVSNAGCSAVVVNFGRYIKAVPEDVIEFSNKVEMPVFSIPWETPIADLTRKYCREIIKNEDREQDIAFIIRNILFRKSDPKSQVLNLEQSGIRENSRFLFLCIGSTAEEDTMADVSYAAEYTARAIRDPFVSFRYRERLIVMLPDYSNDEADLYVSRFYQVLEKKGLDSVYTGIGDNERGIENLRKNFEYAYDSCTIAMKESKAVERFDEADIYRLLLSVRDPELLRLYCRGTIDRIEQSDKENGTDYMEFLRIYLETDGSPNQISSRMYIHRNTVTNYVKRINSILDMDITVPDTRAKLYIAMLIKGIE